MTRLVIGPDHRILLPTSAIVGAIFLVLCDSVARVATGASELPVGVITALAGTPFFIYLLRKEKQVTHYRMADDTWFYLVSMESSAAMVQ